MIKISMKTYVSCAFFLLSICPFVLAQKAAWRQATDAELASLLPARAPVEKEHIETEMRTASGIVNAQGRYIAGVVLLTAGYSADGKYSHYFVVQTPVRIGTIQLKSGEYVFGWTRAKSGDALSVHFHVATTGALVGTVEARRISGSSRVESLHIWPPGDKALIQIGRFGIPYEVVSTSAARSSSRKGFERVKPPDQALVSGPVPPVK
jgi:hypothetical protein